VPPFLFQKSRSPGSPTPFFPQIGGTPDRHSPPGPDLHQGGGGPRHFFFFTFHQGKIRARCSPSVGEFQLFGRDRFSKAWFGGVPGARGFPLFFSPLGRTTLLAPPFFSPRVPFCKSILFPHVSSNQPLMRGRKVLPLCFWPKNPLASPPGSSPSIFCFPPPSFRPLEGVQETFFLGFPLIFSALIYAPFFSFPPFSPPHSLPSPVFCGLLFILSGPLMGFCVSHPPQPRGVHTPSCLAFLFPLFFGPFVPPAPPPFVHRLEKKQFWALVLPFSPPANPPPCVFWHFLSILSLGVSVNPAWPGGFCDPNGIIPNYLSLYAEPKNGWAHSLVFLRPPLIILVPPPRPFFGSLYPIAPPRGGEFRCLPLQLQGT